MSKKNDASRREFLKLTATVAPVTVAALASGSVSAQAAEPDLSVDKMQDTKHIRAYYDSARF